MTAKLDPELAEYDRIVGVAALRALQKFGSEPLDREVAAAHEAGHAVAATRPRPRPARGSHQVKRAARSDVTFVERHREAWVGSIDLPEDEVAAYRAAAVAGGAWQLAREVSFVLAGITGEAVVGLAHPSSSVEDRVREQLISRVAAALELGAAPPSGRQVESGRARPAESSRARGGHGLDTARSAGTAAPLRQAACGAH